MYPVTGGGGGVIAFSYAYITTMHAFYISVHWRVEESEARWKALDIAFPGWGRSVSYIKRDKSLWRRLRRNIGGRTSACEERKSVGRYCFLIRRVN